MRSPASAATLRPRPRLSADEAVLALVYSAGAALIRLVPGTLDRYRQSRADLSAGRHVRRCDVRLVGVRSSAASRHSWPTIFCSRSRATRSASTGRRMLRRWWYSSQCRWWWVSLPDALRRQAQDAWLSTRRVETLFDFSRRLATAVSERDLRAAASAGDHRTARKTLRDSCRDRGPRRAARRSGAIARVPRYRSGGCRLGAGAS